MKTNYTVMAGEATTWVQAESAEEAATAAEARIKEILSAHISPDDVEYPSEMTVRDETTGKDHGFAL